MSFKLNNFRTVWAPIPVSDSGPEIGISNKCFHPKDSLGL